MGEPSLDPKHRAKVLEAIAAAWERVPHQRLCQLLSNALYETGRSEDHFYVTDTKLLDALERFK